MTNQRQVILEEIKKLNSHPTADEIYAKVRKRLPRISLGTIYRNLETLASSGLIKKLGPGLPQKRFDGNTKDHYHITCARCGSIEDAPVEMSDGFSENLENTLGTLAKYRIYQHKLEFIGLCSGCFREGHKFPEDIPEKQH
jgi:Fur family ferric uptake transcriptional regulator